MTKDFLYAKIITVIITDKEFMQVRYSKQREEILSVLKNTKSHPTAEWIYEEVRKLDSTVSLGTVYRNLAFLCQTGQAIALETADKKTHYDGTTYDHAHFVCERCGAVTDVSEEIIVPSSLRGAGYKTNRARYVYYGLCPDCNK